MIRKIGSRSCVIVLAALMIVLSGSAVAAGTPGGCPAKDVPTFAQDGGLCYTGTAPAPGVRPGERSGARGEAAAPESLAGSYVAFDAVNGDACWMPGSTHNLAFTAQSYTNDWEYAYTIWLKFPSDWQVTNVQVIGTPSCTGGGSWGTLSWAYVTGNYEISINHSRYQAYTDACVATYLVTVVTGAAQPSAAVSWFWDGDGYGSAPHWPCSSDSYTPVGQGPCDQAVNPPASVPACALSGVYLSATPVSMNACPGETVTYPFKLFNYTGSSTSFDIGVSGNSWVVSAPTSVGPVADSGSVSFNVSHTIDAGAAGGASDTPTVTATDQANSANNDSLVLTTTALSGGTWNTVASSAPSWSASGYPCRGCTARNSSGQWVTYLIGDTTGGTKAVGFWGYNHATNTWSQPAPSGLPSDRWSPGWAYDSVTNLCYMTGGATTAGGGNLTSAYVFNPVTNAFAALPNFTSARAFHNSWVGTIDGTKYLVIGGGVNSGSTVLSSTQLYDIGAGSWLAENTLMPAYSFGGRWGAAEGLVPAATGNQFWVVSGADSSFALTAAANYFDDADNAWHSGGNVPTPVYRTNGAVHGTDFYLLGGSTGGFSPSALVQQYSGGTWTALDNMPHSRMDLVSGVGENGNIWVVDGYGTSGAADVDYMMFCEGSGGCPTITVAPATLPDATIGLAYSQTLTASGGTAPYTYEVTSGTIPTGMTFDSSTGVLSGTPTAAGTYTFTVMATDSAACTGTATYTINVTFAFDWTFYDDLSRSQVCINSATGYYAWYVLTAPWAGAYIGKSTITPTTWGYTVVEKDKPSGIRLYIYTVYNRASGSFQRPPLTTSSKLIDSDLTDDPACP